MTKHLYDNYTGSFSELTANQEQVWGLRFTMSSPEDITKLGWYRTSTGTNRTPARLALWDSTTGTVVAEPATILDDGTVGWQWSPLSSAFTPTADRMYVVAAGWHNGQPRGNIATSTVLDPDAPLAFYPTNHSAYHNGSASAYPDSSDTNYANCDIETTGVASAPGDSATVDYGVLRQEFARWESADSGTNTHHSDLPWLTKAQADAVKAVVDLIKTGVDNVPKAGDSDWTKIGKLWQIAGALTDAEIAAWNLFAQRAPSQLTGVGGQGGSAFFGGHGTQVADNAETLVERQTLMLSSFPASPWTLIDTTTFDTSLAWDVDADLYTVSFSDTGSAVVNTLASGVDVCYRLAWWAPLNGANGYQRGFIDFPTAHCYYGGQRMPGIVLFSAPGGVGTVEAWRYA